jgi:hypothetical protein
LLSNFSASSNEKCHISTMSTTGAVPEWQQFFASREKPQCRFRDPAPAPLMAEDGWEAAVNQRSHSFIEQMGPV